jgi:hypothetical protein
MHKRRCFTRGHYYLHRPRTLRPLHSPAFFALARAVYYKLFYYSSPVRQALDAYTTAGRARVDRNG